MGSLIRLYWPSKCLYSLLCHSSCCLFLITDNHERIYVSNFIICYSYLLRWRICFCTGIYWRPIWNKTTWCDSRLYFNCLGMAGVVGPVLLSLIYDTTQSYNLTLIIFGVMFAIALALSLWIRVDIKQLQTEKEKAHNQRAVKKAVKV